MIRPVAHGRCGATCASVRSGPSGCFFFSPAVGFHEATDLTYANIQAFTDSLTKKVRKRILRWMVKNDPGRVGRWRGGP